MAIQHILLLYTYLSSQVYYSPWNMAIIRHDAITALCLNDKTKRCYHRPVMCSRCLRASGRLSLQHIATAIISEFHISHYDNLAIWNSISAFQKNSLQQSHPIAVEISIRQNQSSIVLYKLVICFLYNQQCIDKLGIGNIQWRLILSYCGWF